MTAAQKVNGKYRTQGCWSFDDRYGYFGPGGGLVNSRQKLPDLYLIAINDVMGDAGDDVIEHYLGQSDIILLDSGIFNLTNNHMRATGCTMDYALGLPPEALTGFDELFTRYVFLARKFGDRLWGYIELDQGGAVNKRKTRRKLHDLGLDPIPVYHPLNDGWDYFDELASEYNRICLGNIVQASPATRLRILHTLWERRRAYPDLWIHVLGLSPDDRCITFMPDSCDSSSWCSGLRWPAVTLGASMLDRLGGNSDRAFRYKHRTREGLPEGQEWTPLNPSYVLAQRMYSDEVDFLTKIWRRVQKDRASELGESEYPPYLEGEPLLCPAKK